MGICSSIEKDLEVVTINMVEAQNHINIQAKLIEHLSKIQLTQQNNINCLRDNQQDMTEIIARITRGEIGVACQCLRSTSEVVSSNTIILTALEVV
jgi:hypothetical protein